MFQLTIREDHLIRYDQTLYDEEIRLQYAQEECRIQENEIQRLNSLGEEQTHRIQVLQEDLISLQEQVKTLPSLFILSIGVFSECFVDSSIGTI